MTMQLSQLSTTELEVKLKLLEEHVQAEVDHDLDAIMRTWGSNPVRSAFSCALILSHMPLAIPAPRAASSPNTCGCRRIIL